MQPHAATVARRPTRADAWPPPHASGTLATRSWPRWPTSTKDGPSVGELSQEGMVTKILCRLRDPTLKLVAVPDLLIPEEYKNVYITKHFVCFDVTCIAL